LRRRAGGLTRTLVARRRTALRVRLTKAFRRARHRALRHHRSVALTLRVRAADAAGNARTVKVRIRLVRRR
ncbi:MAG TPA: hypothetical protein VGJ32_05125, partial [Solirubrobacteraceae bacterium]